MGRKTLFQANLIHSSVFIAHGAVIRGEVTIEEGGSVWFNAVIRGDTEAIEIGEGTNIQDGAILHADPGFPCTLGRQCSVGHGAIVHGARVADRVLIGMKAVIMNGATIGERSIIGTGSVIGEGKQIPPGSLVAGNPGRIVRSIDEGELSLIELTALHYVEAAREYARGDAMPRG